MVITTVLRSCWFIYFVNIRMYPRVRARCRAISKWKFDKSQVMLAVCVEGLRLERGFGWQLCLVGS